MPDLFYADWKDLLKVGGATGALVGGCVSVCLPVPYMGRNCLLIAASFQQR